LASRFELSALIKGDVFFGFLANGAIDPWLPESNAQNEVVTRAAASAAGHYAANGYATVYDGVIGPWFLPTFSACTGLDSLSYVILLPSVERCVERVATRPDHGFSNEAATRQMHQEFSEANVSSQHVLRDPSERPSDVADLVFSMLEQGALEYPTSPSERGVLSHRPEGSPETAKGRGLGE
jgi:hypothetical protein